MSGCHLRAVSRQALLYAKDEVKQETDRVRGKNKYRDSRPGEQISRRRRGDSARDLSACHRSRALVPRGIPCDCADIRLKPPLHELSRT
jgi:hypothetical protein